MTALAEMPGRAYRRRQEDGLPRLLAGITIGQPADRGMEP
jgi:hypothetical protein